MKILDTCGTKSTIAFKDLPAGAVYRNSCGGIRVKFVFGTNPNADYCFDPENGAAYARGVGDAPNFSVQEVIPTAAIVLKP